MSSPKYVVSTSGVRYQLGECLGEGGQGRVYAVDGGRFAAKILSKNARTDPRRLERHIQFLRTLDLDGIPIAQPEAVLAEPNLGYVMRFLAGMEPLKQLSTPPAGTKSVRQWYFDTGGLRRRLRVCSRAALAIAMLHSKGLCYGDVSPTNIFVAKGIDSDRVYLIDADNLRFDSSPLNQPMYTPGYGAPEVVSGAALASTVTDAHGLAVVAFAALTLVHPLLGDAVENGDPELEERALSGKLPWIDHLSDRSNASTRGIPRGIVLSKVLQEVAARAFEHGLTAPRNRPSAMEWAEALSGAARNCLTCSVCRGAFYRSATACSWCGGARPTFVRGQLRLWDPEARDGQGGFVLGPDKKDLVVDTFTLAGGDRFIVDDRLGLGLRATTTSRDLLQVECSGHRLVLARLSTDVPIELRTTPAREPMPATRTLDLKPARWCSTAVHIGDLGRLHRVLEFWLEGEART